ncbi:ABC transporter substrate-binding protein [Candidatus Woesearchaeota archaeon]|jgi:branched-chain amino acid transport system substrate-binding protein|nr:ABC transporter substrate-binding protein [Candidatus Woesearchaeota archaeon]MBT3538306.1 ABC transporter substrate-binding protein [Candidatus Woesearchaeota archaeon]MBT4696700.1 ABC transporter substrate-binding protein [Candidatus Woesearchaeota archaeon]MBT4716818.1 ABC transporter substrate-binding protein [Candidatus Woesearchaeota archaeon]MBT7105975.1 ABC transporter substrate-binding protein [Candidatus Woesearchaeota archaeon]
MKLLNLAVAIILILGLVGCGNSGITGEVVVEPTQEVVKIGWIGALTSSEASLGIANFRGVELAVEKLNAQGGIDGKKVELVHYDDRHEATKAVTAYKKMKDVDGVDAFIVSGYDSLFALAPMADADKVAVINGLDSSEEIADAGEFAFGIGIYDEGVGYSLADFTFDELEKKEVAVLYQNSGFMVLTKETFKEKFESVGGEVVIEDVYEPEQSDFRSMLIKAQRTGVDTFLVMGYDEVGLLLKQAKEMGIEGTFLTIDTATSLNFVENAQGADDGLYFTFWETGDDLESQQFLTEFRVKYGEDPEAVLFTATGYDSMMFLAESIDEAGVAKGDELKAGMHSVALKGLTGTLSMDDDGIVRSINEVMYQNVEGEFVKLS